MNEKIEIGSEFFIPTECEGITKNIQLFRSCRDSLFFLADYLKKDKIMLPAYSCSSMIKPFLQNNYSISYYSVNDIFEVNEKEFLDKIRSEHIELVLIINYFGHDTFTDQFINEIKEINSDIIIIEDKTQSIFDIPFLRTNVDYAVASLRKWFDIPDGASLVSRNHIKVDFIRDEFFAASKKEIMMIKSKYLNNGLVDKGKMLQAFSESNQLLENINKYKISSYSERMLNEIDVTLYKKIRESNFQILNHFLDQSKFEKVNSNNCCLYYPILIKDRDKIKDRLASKYNIYCPVIWDIDNELCHKWNSLDFLSKHILAIPIDHRYTFDDMLFLCQCINTELQRKR